MAEGTELHRAVALCDVLEVSSLLERGGGLEDHNASRQTALHIAIMGNYEPMVHLLLDKGLSVNTQDKGGCTPLHLAVLSGKRKLVRKLLSLKAETEHKNEYKQTALHLAALIRDWKIFEYLLKAGADCDVEDDRGITPLQIIISRQFGFSQDNSDIKDLINIANDNGKTPLHLAVKKSCLNLVKKLLISGAEVDRRDNAGQTPLHLAIKGNSEEMVMLLLDAGAEVNLQTVKSVSPLHCALAKRNRSIMTKLLDRGADIESKNGDNITALDVAFMKLFEPEVDLLLSRNANVDLSSSFGNHPYSAVDYVVRRNHFNLFKILYDKGADIEANSHDGIPFFNMLDNTFLPAIEYALKEGANVNMRDNNNRTALHKSSCMNDHALYLLLLDYGADIEAKDNNGQTPLFSAVEDGWTECVKLLCERGANVNARDNTGKIPLHYAITAGMVDMLLDSGADMEARDNYGQTPCHMINCSGFNRLIERGAKMESEDINGITPLHEFLRANEMATPDPDIKKVLIAKDRYGKTLLHKAVEWGIVNFVDYLLEKGADVHCKDKCGATPLHEAITSYQEEAAVLIIDKLVRRGASVNVQDDTGDTPLHLAVNNNHMLSIEALLIIGASLDIENNNKETPLQLQPEMPEPIDKLKEHIAKIKTANLLGIFPCTTQSVDIEPFRASCAEELRRMKMVKVGCTSLFHVFSEYKDPKFATNSALENMVMSPSLKINYPLYASILAMTFEKAKQRNFLLDEVNFNILISSVDETKIIHIPNEIKRRILSELTEKDIFNVLEACKQKNNLMENGSAKHYHPCYQIKQKCKLLWINSVYIFISIIILYTVYILAL